jgi:hypothetical protein
MPKGKIPRNYQYQEGDNPLTLAQNYGTTPQALYNANPGGFPFSTGQTINLPIAGVGGKRPVYNAAANSTTFNYETVRDPQHFVPDTTSYKGRFDNVQPKTALVNTPFVAGRPKEVSQNDLQASAVLYRNMIKDARDMYDATGVFDPKLLPTTMSTDMVQQIGYNAGTMTQLGYTMTDGQWKQTGASEKDQTNSEFKNTGFYKEYQQNNVGFLNQLRWDPDTGKYEKIGNLLSSGKLDAQGNWYGGKNKKNNKTKNKSKSESKSNSTGTSTVNFGVGAG